MRKGALQWGVPFLTIGGNSLNAENTTVSLLAYTISDRDARDKIASTQEPDKILFCKTYGEAKIIGSFFSCVYQGKLRIHLVFNELTEEFDQEECDLIADSFRASGLSHGQIWLNGDDKKLIALVDERFRLEPDSEQFFYHSVEYIMSRDCFDKRFDDTVLEARHYEEECIDQYLELLNDSMSFFIPPEDFVSQKDKYLREFKELQEKGAFEAFWKDDQLVGLYWLCGTEVDTIGVSSDFQRLGYGSMILTRAIERVFAQNPAAEYAVLYAVGWNAKAQQFYRKYGMEAMKEHKVPYR
jgi:GNAT superfamily N-acetyltransferase